MVTGAKASVAADAARIVIVFWKFTVVPPIIGIFHIVSDTY